MGYNFSYHVDDEASELVHRYEKYLSGTAPGYFDVEEMERIVEYYLLRGLPKDSLNALELGKKLHPSSNLLEIKRAKIYLATGDIKKAHRILTNLIESSDAEVIFLKIEALIKLERIQEAYEMARKLINSTENEVDMICLDIAMIFMEESNFETAMKILQKGDEYNPKNTDLLFELAFCAEQKNKLFEAINYYKRIIDLNPYIGEAWFNLGQIYFLQSDYPNAIEAYDYALVINEEDSISLIQKAHAQFQSNQLKKAIETYLAYAEMTSEKWQVMLFVGESYEKLENFPKALYYYKLSLEEMPDNYDALTGISICLLEMEIYDECLDYIRKAMEINDGLSDAWVYMAEAHIGLDHVDEALEAYLKSISIDPVQPDTLMAIANIYMDDADFQTALKYYELAYSFDTNLEYIEMFLAVAYYYTSDYDNTAKFLELAVQRNLDAVQMFLELCPGASTKFLSDQKTD